MGACFACRTTVKKQDCLGAIGMFSLPEKRILSRKRKHAVFPRCRKLFPINLISLCMYMSMICRNTTCPVNEEDRGQPTVVQKPQGSFTSTPVKVVCKVMEVVCQSELSALTTF